MVESTPGTLWKAASTHQKQPPANVALAVVGACAMETAADVSALAKTPCPQAPTLKGGHAAPAAKLSATPLLQYRLPVGAGPSLKT